MSDLALDTRNFLAGDAQLTALLGSDLTWTTWMFTEVPYVLIENSSSALVVITQSGGWAAPNAHNTMSFPRLVVDIWADPTRSRPSNAVQIQDAKQKINTIHKAIFKNLHTVSKQNSVGGSIIWGTPAQIADKSGTRIQGSQLLGEPEFSPVGDGSGAFMGRIYYGVTI